MHMLGCLAGPPLSETGQRQSLGRNYGKPSENGQSLFLKGSQHGIPHSRASGQYVSACYSTLTARYLSPGPLIPPCVTTPNAGPRVTRPAPREAGLGCKTMST